MHTLWYDITLLNQQVLSMLSSIYSAQQRRATLPRRTSQGDIWRRSRVTDRRHLLGCRQL